MAMRSSRAKRPGTRSPGVKPGRPAAKALNAQDARKMLLESMAEQNISKMRYVLPFAKEFYIPEATLAENLLQFFTEKKQWDGGTAQETQGSTRSSPATTPRNFQRSGSAEELEEKVQKSMNSLMKRSRFQPWANTTDTEERLEKDVKIHMDVMMERRTFQQVIWPTDNSSIEENNIQVTQASSSRDGRLGNKSEELPASREPSRENRRDRNASPRGKVLTPRKTPSREPSREPRKERGLVQRDAQHKPGSPSSPEAEQSRQTPDRTHNASGQPTALEVGLATQMESQIKSLLQAFPAIREKLVSLEERVVHVETVMSRDEIQQLCDQLITQKQASLVQQIKESVVRSRAAEPPKQSNEASNQSEDAPVSTTPEQAQIQISEHFQQFSEDWEIKIKKRDNDLEHHLQQSLQDTLKAHEEAREKELREWLTTIVARQDGKTLERLEERLDEQKSWLTAELANNQSALAANGGGSVPLQAMPSQEMESQTKTAIEFESSMQELKKEWEDKLRDREQHLKKELTEETTKLITVEVDALLQRKTTALNASAAEIGSKISQELDDKMQSREQKFREEMKALIAEAAKGNAHGADSHLQSQSQSATTVDAPDTPVVREFRRSEVTFQQKLGEGAQGQVWLGSVSGSTVAIKYFPGEQGTDAFNLERDCLMRFQHPNIVALIGAVDDSEGKLLLEEHLQPCNWSELNHAAAIADVLKALVYIHHRNIVHLDIKPDNVMQDASGNIKLIDFSVGSPSDEHRGFIGSLPFAAPELLADAPWKGKPVDLYAVGVLIAFLVQLKALFDYLGFALQLNDDSVARTAALPQLRNGVANLAQEMIRIAGAAGDLAARLMDLEPSSRPTADQAMADTWVKPYVGVF